MLLYSQMTSLESARTNLHRAFESSPAMAFLRHSKALWSDAWTRSRSLNALNVSGLERRGNTCSDWTEVRLLGEGSLDAIHHCRFEGQVILRLEKGAPQLWRSRFRNALIGAATVENVNLAERVIIEDGATLRSVQEISGRKNSRFCLGLPIHPGSEMKTRRVFLCDGLLLSDCDRMTGLVAAEQEMLTRDVASWLQGVESDYAFVGTGAHIERTSLVENCFIGRGAMIRGAASLRRCMLASNSENPIHIGEAVIVDDAVLEPGSKMDSAGQAHRSILLESSSVERAGQVDNTVLGPNTHVAKGEITGSLVGPFVGFHHQALLIGALWPEGHGNVAYGANVGSNHTGRKPDQEIKPGEGSFFGLGCSIKFPADFSAAPFSLFATGITTLPQRVVFPMSLMIASLSPAPESAFGLNEIIPGWMWGENAYALIRNAYKYLDRDQSQRHVLPDPSAPENSPLHGSFLSSGLFAPRNVSHVIHALLELRRISKSKDVYFEKDLPGLGKNFLRENHRTSAIAAYENYLRFALYRELLWNAVATPLLPEASPIVATLGLSATKKPDFEPATLFQNLIQSVESSLAKDDKRGREIFHDYGSFHEESSTEPVCLRLHHDLDCLHGILQKRWGNMIANAPAQS